jgi:hypothetical protein
MYVIYNRAIHSVFCLTTGPKPFPKQFLHIVRSRASSFKWEYPFLSLRSSSSFLRLLPRLLVTSISPFIFPSITCFRRQFLRKMWPIQLDFRFLISCRIFLRSNGRRQTKRDTKTDAGSSVISSGLKHRTNDARDGSSSCSNRRGQSGFNGCCTAMWKANGKNSTLSFSLNGLFPKVTTSVV